MIREEKRSQVEDEIRLRVDALMREELDLLKIVSYANHRSRSVMFMSFLRLCFAAKRLFPGCVNTPRGSCNLEKVFLLETLIKTKFCLGRRARQGEERENQQEAEKGQEKGEQEGEEEEGQGPHAGQDPGVALRRARAKRHH